MRYRLIEWEEEHGYTGKYIAERLGISAPTWCMIKNGKQNPTFMQVMRFKEVFGVEEVLDLFKNISWGGKIMEISEIERVDDEVIKLWLDLNSKLQQKKHNIRKILKERGILKKGGQNDYDKYQYFSEAQYKELFTELFAECKLELKFDEVEYETFEGTEKQSNGRMPKIKFR